ncbi:MAG: hypothetical protein P8X47_09860 [Ignavibacteriaceae bacterium]
MISQKIAGYVVNRKLKEKQNSELSFTGFFKKSFNFFVLMPDDEKDFNSAMDVLHLLDSNEKHFKILTHDYRLSLLPQKFRPGVIDYGIDDVTKLKLPSKDLIEKLQEMNFDIIIDLNRNENLFCSYSANVADAQVRIGMRKSGADKYYNFQYRNSNDNSEIFYKNFLNCLQMF